MSSITIPVAHKQQASQFSISTSGLHLTHLLLQQSEVFDGLAIYGIEPVVLVLGNFLPRVDMAVLSNGGTVFVFHGSRCQAMVFGYITTSWFTRP